MKIVNGLLVQAAQAAGLNAVDGRDGENDILVVSYRDDSFGYRLSEIIMKLYDGIDKLHLAMQLMAKTYSDEYVEKALSNANDIPNEVRDGLES